MIIHSSNIVVALNGSKESAILCVLFNAKKKNLTRPDHAYTA